MAERISDRQSHISREQYKLQDGNGEETGDFSLKIGNRNIVFAAHLQFFLIGNTFGTIVKKTCHLCIFDIISMDHSQTCAGVHNAHGMLETILIQVFGKFFQFLQNRNLPWSDFLLSVNSILFHVRNHLIRDVIFQTFFF